MKTHWHPPLETVTRRRRLRRKIWLLAVQLKLPQRLQRHQFKSPNRPISRIRDIKTKRCKAKLPRPSKIALSWALKCQSSKARHTLTGTLPANVSAGRQSGPLAALPGLNGYATGSPSPTVRKYARIRNESQQRTTSTARIEFADVFSLFVNWEVFRKAVSKSLQTRSPGNVERVLVSKPFVRHCESYTEASSRPIQRSVFSLDRSGQDSAAGYASRKARPALLESRARRSSRPFSLRTDESPQPIFAFAPG